MSDAEFDSLFTLTQPIVFAYHGYPWLIHRLTYRRTNHDNLHVRGYKEEGTTTTPFDMVMLNDLDRFHLVIDVARPRSRSRRTCGAPSPGDAGAPPGCPRLHTRQRRRRAGDSRLDVAVLTDVLVVNAGSTSLKLSVVDGNDESTAVASLEDALESPRSAIASSTAASGSSSRLVIDDAVASELAALVELAPLHNAPHSRRSPTLAGGFPTPRTSRSSTRPSTARSRRSPARTRCPSATATAASAGSASTASPSPGPPSRYRRRKLVVCHLGGGVSVTAVADGRSIDTTMGFTPLEGAPMGTRAGSVDPGALLYLLRHGVTLDELDEALEHESGLVGLAGTEDVGALENERVPEGDARPRRLLLPHRTGGRGDGRGTRRDGCARLHGRRRRALAAGTRSGLRPARAPRRRDRRRGEHRARWRRSVRTSVVRGSRSRCHRPRRCRRRPRGS